MKAFARQPMVQSIGILIAGVLAWYFIFPLLPVNLHPMMTVGAWYLRIGACAALWYVDRLVQRFINNRCWLEAGWYLLITAIAVVALTYP